MYSTKVIEVYIKFHAILHISLVQKSLQSRAPIPNGSKHCVVSNYYLLSFYMLTLLNMSKLNFSSSFLILFISNLAILQLVFSVPVETWFFSAIFLNTFPHLTNRRSYKNCEKCFLHHLKNYFRSQGFHILIFPSLSLSLSHLSNGRRNFENP